MELSEELVGELYNKYGKELKKGEEVFKENDTANEVYVVISGKIQISKNKKSGKFSYEKIIATISGGEIFGEMALLTPNSKRSASAYVVEDTRIIVINRTTFYAMIRYNAEFSLQLMERLSSYVARTNKEYEELRSGQKKLLIIETILEIHNKEKIDKIDLNYLLESENILGLTEDTAINILKQLDNLESISFDGKTIIF
jgi:CRP/FNR family transcriptional regulator, cyclic AMP receptor protein